MLPLESHLIGMRRYSSGGMEKIASQPFAHIALIATSAFIQKGAVEQRIPTLMIRRMRSWNRVEHARSSMEQPLPRI